MNKQTMFTELSIQIAVLEAKIDKVLQLLMQSEVEYEVVNSVQIDTNDFSDRLGQYVADLVKPPPQWPNESHIGYLKRIGQYNEAQSDDEFYGETYK